MNLGYRRNANRVDEREDLWHVSAAGSFHFRPNLQIVANAEGDENPDPSAGDDFAFILGGLIYSPVENFDIDFGVLRGLAEGPDYSILAGITLRL